MTDDEGLSVREAVEWCGSGVTVRKVTRLAPPGGRPVGRRRMSPRRASAAGLAAPHGGGRACGNLAGYRVAAPTSALRMALVAGCSATWTSTRSGTRPRGSPRSGGVVLGADRRPVGSLCISLLSSEAIKEQRRAPQQG